MYQTLILVLICFLCVSVEASSNEARLSGSPSRYYPDPWARAQLLDGHLQIKLSSDEFKPRRAKPREIFILGGIVVSIVVLAIILVPRD